MADIPCIAGMESFPFSPSLSSCLLLVLVDHPPTLERDLDSDHGSFDLIALHLNSMSPTLSSVIIII
jgi:hypothetical protein